jgi:hypothetical protein
MSELTNIVAGISLGRNQQTKSLRRYCSDIAGRMPGQRHELIDTV